MNRVFPNNVAKAANNNLPTAINRVANAVANGAANTLNAAVNNAGNTFKTGANEIGEVMANAPQAVNNALFGVPEKIGNAVSNATNGLTNAANKMTNFVNSATNKVLNTVGLNSGNINGNLTTNANRNANRNANANANRNANSINFMNNLNASAEGPGFFGSVWFFILITLLTLVGIFIFFFDQIMELLPPSVRDGFNRLKAAFGIPVDQPSMPPAEPPADLPADLPDDQPVEPPADMPAILPGVPTPAYLPDSGVPQLPDMSNIPGISDIINKQLPQQKKEVFNIKENRYRYEDAEPLCNALGAELATYQQVKESYEQGADWCNYGWVKGQQAVYPTQDATYEKLQKGPKEQRQACGKPGVNGGYFDNPDLRFGVTCYGVKPPQKDHDSSLLPNGEANPFTPDALEYDKRVAEFKADSQNIGILPFSQGRWDEV